VLFSTPVAEVGLVDVVVDVLSTGCIAVVAVVAVTGAGLSSLSLLVVFAAPEITLPVDVVPPADIDAPVLSSTN
jgi:hypothetical protein